MNTHQFEPGDRVKWAAEHGGYPITQYGTLLEPISTYSTEDPRWWIEQDECGPTILSEAIFQPVTGHS